MKPVLYLDSSHDGAIDAQATRGLINNSSLSHSPAATAPFALGRHLEEASRAASLLVWSKRDDGSSTLIGVPLNVDGTRCEAPRDAEGFSDAFCRCAAVAALGHTIWMGLILKELLGYNST